MVWSTYHRSGLPTSGLDYLPSVWSTYQWSGLPTINLVYQRSGLPSTYQPFWAPSHMVGATLVQFLASSPPSSASGGAAASSLDWTVLWGDGPETDVSTGPHSRR